MNCKPGDLAVIVRSYAGNEGKIVRCIRLVDYVCWGRPDGSEVVAPTWKIDRELRGCRGDVSDQIEDSLLSPIRPGDITDEEVRELYAPKTLQEA